MPKIIATRWAMQDGEAALTWLSTQPEGPERDLAVRVAFKSWATLSKPAAFQWLGDHGIDGVEPWLVPAVTIYSRLISQDDPALALEWAALIPNDLERETSMVRIARRLRNKDEAAGEKWLDQSPLSERQRNQARSPDALTR